MSIKIIVYLISHIKDTHWGIGMLHTVLGHCDLDLWPQYLKNPEHTPMAYNLKFRAWMHIDFKIVAYYFTAAVTLTSDLSRIKMVH